MQPSSILCRAQEATQRARSAATTLPSVKALADSAAAAWCQEAIFAEQREARLDRTRIAAAEQLDAKQRDGLSADEDADLERAAA